MARVAPEKTVIRPVLPLRFQQPELHSERRMAKMTYGEQLKHPNWQRKRLEILQRDGFTCQECYDTESTLHVHHKRYVKGRSVWEYEGHELVTLCDQCHEAAHSRSNRLSFVCSFARSDGPYNHSELIALLAGWLGRGVEEDFDFESKENERVFTVGEIAAVLSIHFDATSEKLVEFRDALERVPYGELTKAVDAMIAALNR